MLAKVASGSAQYLLSDRLSTRLLLDTGGNIGGRQAHLPFGEDFGESGTQEKHHFTSYERDGESGTDYGVNRQYAEGVGRFMRADPMSGSIRDPQTLNRYTYVKNTPANGKDPLGLFIQCGEGVNGCTICAEYDDETEEFIRIVSQTCPDRSGDLPGIGDPSAPNPERIIEEPGEVKPGDDPEPKWMRKQEKAFMKALKCQGKAYKDAVLAANEVFKAHFGPMLDILTTVFGDWRTWAAAALGAVYGSVDLAAGAITAAAFWQSFLGSLTAIAVVVLMPTMIEMTAELQQIAMTLNRSHWDCFEEYRELGGKLDPPLFDFPTIKP